MGWILGTDEAGYGPNLGPLVICATAWHVDGDPVDIDLYERLRQAVTSRVPVPSKQDRARRVVLADSKRVYQPDRGLSLLERGVLSAMGTWSDAPDGLEGLWQIVVPQTEFPCGSEPWLADFECLLPVDGTREAVVDGTQKLRRALEACGVRLVAQRCRVVFPAEFNALVLEWSGKGELLSRLTIELAAQTLEMASDGPALVVCDKHGGRNSYGPLLQQQFPDSLVQVRGESRGRSVYVWSHGARAVQARFQVGAESHLAVALASMTAKYLREVFMKAFNAFWRRHVPGLAPTAGYPLDARRFKREIAERQNALGIKDASIWRAR